VDTPLAPLAADLRSFHLNLQHGDGFEASAVRGPTILSELDYLQYTVKMDRMWSTRTASEICLHSPQWLREQLRGSSIRNLGGAAVTKTTMSHHFEL
jgi:hypothetical protein